MEDLASKILPKNLIRKTTVLDVNGEVVKETSVFVIPRVIDYVKVMAPWKGMCRVLTGTEMMMLWEMAFEMTYADKSRCGQKVYMIRPYKEELMEKTGISLPTINNSLTKMARIGIIRRVGMGTYQINPFFIGRGRKNELYKLQQSYGVGDGTFADEIVKKELSNNMKEEKNYG